MIRAHSAVVSLLLSLLFLPSSTAQDYEVSVTSINVWVQVTDSSGTSIRNLTADDFVVYEDNKAMKPTCFEEMGAPTTSPPEVAQEPETAPARSDVGALPQKPIDKQVIFLLDLFNTSQPEYLFIEPKLIDFVKRLSRTGSFTVALLLPSGVLEVKLSATNDVAEVMQVLESLRANVKRDQSTLDKRRTISLVLSGGRDEDSIRTACRLAQQYSHEEIANSKFTLESLEALDQHLSKLTGDLHTVIVFISGGINANPGKQYFDYISGGDTWELAKAYSECSPDTNTGLRNKLSKLIARMNRHNITFYTVNTRGTVNALLDTAAEADRRIQQSDFDFLHDLQDFMFQMANETGGLTFENSLNFDKGFDLVVKDLAHSYLICYNAPQHKKEGEYHKIQVQCRRPNTTLRFRKGYLD